MNRSVFLNIGLIVSAFLIVGAQAADLTGRQILDEVATRHTRDFEFETQRMTIFSKGVVGEVRDLRRYARKINNDETRYLLTFTGPRGVRGVALLTWSSSKRDDDQWLYLPAEGDRTKRIAKGGRRTSFMGTDYAYEDIIAESREKFAYARQPDETVDGAMVFVVDATAAEPELAHETGYRSRRLFILQDRFFVVRLDYYDRRGELFKRQLLSDLVEIQPSAWRANSARMENLREKTATVIESLERRFDQASVPERNFLERFLTSQEHMK